MKWFCNRCGHENLHMTITIDEMLCDVCWRKQREDVDLVDKAIISYVKENPNITHDKLIKYLTENHISSRVTVLQHVKRLVVLGLLEDKKIGNSFHRLLVNKNNLN